MLPASFEPHEVASQLPDITRQTIISYALLPRGLATWVYDNRGVFAHWTEGSPKDIAALARRFRSLCSDAASDEADLRKNAAAFTTCSWLQWSNTCLPIVSSLLNWMKDLRACLLKHYSTLEITISPIVAPLRFRWGSTTD